MKKLLVSGICLLLFINLFAQNKSTDPLVIEFPTINLHPVMGVVTTKVNALQYDSSLTYKIAVDISNKSSKSKAMNESLREAARIYNLTRATGVPENKITMALVIHGDAIDAIYNDQAYKKEYGFENPNTELIKTFKKLGVHLYICGQNLGYKKIPVENLAPEIEIAVSAKTAFIVLDQKGYTFMSTN